MRVLLVVYDNGGYVHWFPQGIGYLASSLKEAGHEVELWNQDWNHWEDWRLTKYLDEGCYDVVGVGVVGGYYQYRKLLVLSGAINASYRRPVYVIGGHGPSPEPGYFLERTGADFVVCGEGERTLVDLLANLYEPWKVKGIAYYDYEKMDVVVNERRALCDVDSLPLPAYDMFPMEYYRMLRMPHCTSSDFVVPVLSGRGCPFACNFCYRMDEGFRPRHTDLIVEEIQYLQERWGLTYVAFSDELLMSSVDRATELSEAFLSAGLGVKWDCNGRLNYAKPGLLKLMKRAGCVYINYGIEAVDDRILKNMNKCLNVDTIHKGIEATISAGISPGFNIIWGNLGENRDTLQKGVDFLLKYDDGAEMRTIRPVTPYPGSPLYYEAIKQGFLKDCADFYDNKHMNSDLLAVNFTDMSDVEFHGALYKANKCLIANYFDKKKADVIGQAKQLYSGDANFRGFRQD